MVWWYCSTWKEGKTQAHMSGVGICKGDRPGHVIWENGREVKVKGRELKVWANKSFWRPEIPKGNF